MDRSLTIDGYEISDDNDCYVVAEIGCNHQGDVEKAKQMIARASFCGVNAVKFQKRDNKALFTKAMYDSPYDNPNSFGATYGIHREALELGREEWTELQAFARQFDVTMFATPFDFPSVDFLADLNIPAYKTASGDLTNIPLLKYVAQLGKPMIVSTGGATVEDVRRAYDALMPINPQVAILQCTSSYPAEPEDLNLRVIETYRTMFSDIVIGLSDHQNGIAMALVGYLMGARIIEKHFTINRAWKGTDQAFSLEAEGMRKLVRDLHRARMAIGDGVKAVRPNEQGPLYKMRKKLVAGRDMPAGHVLTRADIAIKAPGDGIPPFHLDTVIGKAVRIALREDEDISWGNLGMEMPDLATMKVSNV